MAAETSGGRIGKTIYMDPEAWDKLDRLVRGAEIHPALKPNIRRSMSSVLEAMLIWDAPKAFEQQEQKQRELEGRLQTARAIKWAAGRNRANLDMLERQFKQHLAQVKEALSELEGLEL